MPCSSLNHQFAADGLDDAGARTDHTSHPDRDVYRGRLHGKDTFDASHDDGVAGSGSGGGDDDVEVTVRLPHYDGHKSIFEEILWDTPPAIAAVVDYGIVDEFFIVRQPSQAVCRRVCRDDKGGKDSGGSDDDDDDECVCTDEQLTRIVCAADGKYRRAPAPASHRRTVNKHF
jgi:hypothetical protein